MINGGNITPKIEKSSGRGQCPFCDNKHKKGASIVSLQINRGPTGTVHYCLEHARQLATDIMQIANDCPDRICGKVILVPTPPEFIDAVTYCTEPEGHNHPRALLFLSQLYDGQVVEGRLSMRDNAEGTGPDWGEWETVTLFLRRREKDLPKSQSHHRDSRKGDIIELTIQQCGDNWASYTQSDYDPNTDEWLCEQFRMQLRSRV